MNNTLSPYKYLFKKLGLKLINVGSKRERHYILICKKENLNFGYFSCSTYEEIFKSLTQSPVDKYIIELKPFVRILKQFPKNILSKDEVDIYFTMLGLN